MDFIWWFLPVIPVGFVWELFAVLTKSADLIKHIKLFIQYPQHQSCSVSSWWCEIINPELSEHLSIYWARNIFLITASGCQSLPLEARVMTLLICHREVIPVPRFIFPLRINTPRARNLRLHSAAFCVSNVQRLEPPSSFSCALCLLFMFAGSL